MDDLVAARKACRTCMMTDPGDIRAGAEFDVDPDVVSSWSQWLGHGKPLVLVVAQDFGDVSSFVRDRGADEPDNKTNNLHVLLKWAGLVTGAPPAFDATARVDLTNSILCLKQPPMNRPIRSRWVRACATRHLAPLARRLTPPIIVGMGTHGWQAVRIAFDLVDAPARSGPPRAACGRSAPARRSSRWVTAGRWASPTGRGTCTSRTGFASAPCFGTRLAAHADPVPGASTRGGGAC